jgi:hypothetical protein
MLGMKDSNADNSTPNVEIKLTTQEEFLGLKNGFDLRIDFIGLMILFVINSRVTIS